MAEDRQTFLYFIRSGLQNPKPATFLFLVSMIAFAAMIATSYVYYAAQYGPFPSLTVSFMTQANTHNRAGNHEAAATEYADAEAIWPTYARLMYNQGLNYLESGNVRKAIETYERFLKIDPDDPSIRHALGYSYATVGNYESAINHLSRATALGPVAYLDLGAAYEAAGQLEQAAENYQRAAELSPGNPRAREKYAAVMQRIRER